MTEDALRPRGIAVDRAGFDSAMAEQKAKARAAWKGSGEKAGDDLWFDLVEEFGPTEFTGYSGHEGEGIVHAIVRGGQRVERAGEGEEVLVLFNQTPFYGESGGQVGDAGKLTSLKGLEAQVKDTSKPLGKLHMTHAVIAKGDISVGDTVHQSVDSERRAATRANHSATHLLHAALRNLLGEHVTQKGSLVAPDRLRFDFSHPKALSPDEIAAVEAEVNAEIRANQPVSTRLMTPDDAVQAGALALFGEKYGDEVRVLSMGRQSDKHYSVELCGGTHVNATGDIALFKIVAESAVSSGVRRIDALTGEGALAWLNARDARLRDAAASLKTSPEDVPMRVAAMAESVRRLEKELADAKKALAMGGGSAKSEAARPGGCRRRQIPRPGRGRPRSQGLARRSRQHEAARRQRCRRFDRGQRGPRQRRRRRDPRPHRPGQRRRPRPGRGRRARRAGRRRTARHGPGRRTRRRQGRRRAKRDQRSADQGRRLNPASRAPLGAYLAGFGSMIT